MATAKEDENTDEFSQNICDPCNIDDEHTHAFSFCEECHQYLCEHCHKTHRRLAATRNHTVKGQDEQQTKTILKVESPDKCLAHPTQEIAYYCKLHNELCCSKCLSSVHKTCKNIKNLANYVREFDVEQEEKKLKGKVKTLSNEVTKTMFMVQHSIKAIEYHHDQAESKMTEAKRNAIEHIEKIFGTLDDELKKIRETDLKKITPLRHKCSAVSFDMRTLESYFYDKTGYTKSQLALAIRNADVKISSNCCELSDVRCNGQLNITRYVFKPDQGIVNMKTRPSSFGSMEVQNDIIKTASKVKSLQIKDAEEDDDCCITGLALLSDSRLILVDNNNLKIKLVDTEEDKIISNLLFESQPWDVTCVTNDKVAVTLPEKKTIEILSVGKNLTFDATDGNTIACTDKCYGITSYKDTIIVIVRQNEETSKIERYELNGLLVLSVEVDVKNPQYVVCNEDETKMYISDNCEGSYIVELSCDDDFTILDTLSSCKDEVTGMTIDKTGVMYYCNSYDHEIDVVYLNKKEQSDRERQALFSDKSPGPECLVFCDETNRLFVGLEGNEISVYEVF